MAEKTRKIIKNNSDLTYNLILTHTKSCSFSHTHTYTRVGSNRNNNRLAENDEVNSDPYHTVPKSSTVEGITHHRRFPDYILSKKLKEEKKHSGHNDPTRVLKG